MKINIYDYKINSELRLKNEKIRTLDLPLKNNTVTSKLESQILTAESFDLKLEIMFTQTTHANIKPKTQFRNFSMFCDKLNHSVPNCFCKQREDEEKNGIPIIGRKHPSNHSFDFLKHTRVKLIPRNILHLIL